jgi:hypothetical protein
MILQFDVKLPMVLDLNVTKKKLAFLRHQLSIKCDCNFNVKIYKQCRMVGLCVSNGL